MSDALWIATFAAIECALLVAAGLAARHGRRVGEAPPPRPIPPAPTTPLWVPPATPEGEVEGVRERFDNAF